MVKKVKFSETVEILGKDDSNSIISVNEFIEENRRNRRNKFWNRVKRFFKYLFCCFILYCMCKYNV